MKTRSRSEMLAKEQIGKLLFKLSVPAIIGMAVQALYGLVDSIFIGHVIGTLGIGAIAVFFPIQMVNIAINQTIGVGGASRISRFMGSGESEKAGFTLGSMILLALIASGSLMAVGLTFTEPILRIFGATDDIMPYAIEYFQIVVAATPLFSFHLVVNNALRAEGNTRFIMIIMILSANANLILDIILIVWLDMGMQGAAIATAMAIVVAALALLFYLATGKSEIPVGLNYLRLKYDIVKKILTVGSPALARVGSMSITAMIANNSLRIYGGDIGIACFGILFRLFMFAFVPMLGLAQGVQPIIGYNYGAKQYLRANRSIKFSCVIATIMATISFLVLALFPAPFISVFTKDQELIDASIYSIRLAIMCWPFIGIQIVGSSVFLALGKTLPALIIALLRQVIVLIPLMLFLPRFIGLDGVWYAFSLADFLSFIPSIIMLLSVMRKLSQSETAPPALDDGKNNVSICKPAS